MVPYRRHMASMCSLALCCAVLLAGCAEDRPYTAPGFAFLTSYKAQRSGVPVLLNNAEWWRGLNEPVLNQLIALALRDNLSLAVTRERVVQARAEAQTVAPAFSLSPAANAYIENDSGGSPVATGTAELGFGWMLDPWGGKRSERKAAAARIDIAAAEVDAGQLLLLYNLANAYVDLRYRQQLIALQQRELAGWQSTLRITKELAKADAATQLEIKRSQAHVAEIQAQLPGLKADAAMKQNEIAVLAGFAPGQLPVDLSALRSQPAAKMSASVGIPADLLRNRPDLRLAERSYYAALQDIGVAQAARYPQVSLVGAISLNALESRGTNSDYYFGPSLQVPNPVSSEAKARVSARESLARQAYTSWKASVMQAILEVENALLDYKATSESLSASSRAVTLYSEARGMTDEVFRSGSATLSDMIDADQEVSSAKKSLAFARYRQALSFIALNVRLGSGHAAQRIAGAP